MGPLFLMSPSYWGYVRLNTVDLRPEVGSIKEEPSKGKIQAFHDKTDKRKKFQEELKKELEIQRLAQIDQKVRAHEMAHMAVGGQYAGGASYSYVVGPDGRMYAVAGEVPIDLSDEPTPEATVAKMQQVIAAALAPADPSPQDYKVAAIASQKLMRAFQELARKRLEELNGHKGENHTTSEKSLGALEKNETPQREDKNQASNLGREKPQEDSKGDFIKLNLPKALRSYYENSKEGRNCLLCFVKGET